MPDNASVTSWIAGLKQGDEDSAHALWQRYFEKLVRLTRERLGDGSRRVADEQDVAVSAFKSLCDFAALADREELWRLLTTITASKSGTSPGRSAAAVTCAAIRFSRARGQTGLSFAVSSQPRNPFA